MSTTSMNRAIGFSMVLFSCLPLNTGCGSDGSDTTSPTANQPSFIAETHSATDSQHFLQRTTEHREPFIECQRHQYASPSDVAFKV